MTDDLNSIYTELYEFGTVKEDLASLFAGLRRRGSSVSHINDVKARVNALRNSLLGFRKAVETLKTKPN